MDFSVPETILESSREVFPLTINNQPVFVKKNRPYKRPGAVKIQKFIYAITRNPFVIPAYHPVETPVEFEVKRLRELADKGIRVPEVLHEDKDYFVMSTVGESVEDVLKSLPPSEHQALLNRCLTALRSLHDRGIAHGGTQIRNFALHNDEIYFIDFEVPIPESQLRQFKLRDLFLFFMSLPQRGFDFDVAASQQAYEQGDETLFPELKKIFSRFSFIRIIEKPFFNRYSMKDVRLFCKLTKKFQEA